MRRLPDPGPAGQETDPPEPRHRAEALKFTEAEAHAVRVAIRKVARVRGGFVALAVALAVPTNTLYHAARPGSRPSAMLVIRLAAVVGVPVEVLIGGKVVVAPVVIGVAA